MGSDDFCDTSLVLGLGFSSSIGVKPVFSPPEKIAGGADEILPSLTLSLSGDRGNGRRNHAVKMAQSEDDVKGGFNDHQHRQESAASSFSNVSVKREREREIAGSEEAETERVSSRASDEDDDGSHGRKKLRLTKIQSALLEESFKLHSTLNPKQKQDLAHELKLTPRQVEVWFQNRRARTKLKQTEMDCEALKKSCQTLTDENLRLQKELHELKALKHAQPMYMQLPAATLTICPSCERLGGGGATAENQVKSSFTMAPKPHLFNRFTNQSAAC